MANATEQQKQVYDTIVLQALKFIFSDQTAKRFIENAKSDPVDAMVGITTIVLKNIKQSAASAGRNYAGDPVFIKAAAKEIMSNEAEMLVMFNVIKKQEERGVVNQALTQFAEV